MLPLPPPERNADFRRGLTVGFGTGLLAGAVLLLIGIGLAFGMFTHRSWFVLAPGLFFFGFGRRGLLHGLLVSAAITLAANALIWLVVR